MSSLNLNHKKHTQTCANIDKVDRGSVPLIALTASNDAHYSVEEKSSGRSRKNRMIKRKEGEKISVLHEYFLVQNIHYII